MKISYVNGVILDGTENMTAVKGKCIVTENGIITDICDGAPADGEIIDLKGAYIMPGLINLHVHLPAGGNPSTTKTDVKKLVKIVNSNPITRFVLKKVCENNAKQQLMSGVTTIRTVGGIGTCDSDLRNSINSGKTLGPRILASDMAVSVPGGHMAGSLAYEATTAEEAAEYVRKIAKAKPDLIKVMITGGVLDAKKKGEPGELKMMPDLVKAACDTAHSLGLKVAAHVESPEGVKIALENGVDTVEHGSKTDAEIIGLFKKHNACDVATFSPALPCAKFDRSVMNTTETEQFNGNIVFEGIIDCARKCLENGITVGLGTDTGCPYITHYDTWREVCYFQKYCGVSNAFALHTATLVNAKIAGIDCETGSIEKGKSADMIITGENPLENLAALRNVRSVVIKGRYIAEARVKRISSIDSQLDKYIN